MHHAEALPGHAPVAASGRREPDGVDRDLVPQVVIVVVPSPYAGHDLLAHKAHAALPAAPHERSLSSPALAPPVRNGSPRTHGRGCCQCMLIKVCGSHGMCLADPPSLRQRCPPGCHSHSPSMGLGLLMELPAHEKRHTAVEDCYSRPQQGQSIPASIPLPVADPLATCLYPEPCGRGLATGFQVKRRQGS